MGGDEDNAVQDLHEASGLKPFSAAFSQHPRCAHGGSCAKGFSKDIEYMGYSIRTASWRYTEWKPWNGAELRPNWEDTSPGSELYSHDGDDGTDMDAFENENLAGNPSYSSTVQYLSAMLWDYFQNSSRMAAAPHRTGSSERPQPGWSYISI